MDVTEKTSISQKKALQFVLSLLLPLAILLLQPIGLSLAQSAVLAALALTITWWLTNLVDRTYASIFLLLVFLLVSGAPVKTVFSFPLSPNFLIIAFSFLFSQGIANSGLIQKLLQPLLLRHAYNLPRLIFSMLILAFVMCFILPQPLARLLILAAIYLDYFAKIKLGKPLQLILLVGLYYFSTVLNMAFYQGDLILNGAMLSISGVPVTPGAWMHYMTVPTLGYLLLSILLYLLVFRKEFRQFPAISTDKSEQGKVPLTGTEKRNLIFILIAVLLWATETLHGIAGVYIVIAASVLMFPLGLLKLPDLKAVNPKLLVFLTAAFSIGGVLKACGVADTLFALFTPLFPGSFSWQYALLVVLTAAVLHMVLGSNITTMSVVVPGLMTIAAGVAPSQPMIFLMLITICSQFIFPFHHVGLTLGEGSGHYTARELMRIGIPHSFLMAACAILLYLPWWASQGFL